MKNRIGVVILNYMNYVDTIACVNCTLNQSYTDYEIIIVDNGSSNQNGPRNDRNAPMKPKFSQAAPKQQAPSQGAFGAAFAEALKKK